MIRNRALGLATEPPSSSPLETDRLSKWRAFLATSKPRLSDRPVNERLVPLVGTPVFETFTDTEKRRLFIGFAQLNAEALVVFESFAIAAYRFHARPEAREISLEELHHSRGYRKFLREEPEINWPRESLILKRDAFSAVFRRWVYGLIMRFPAALALPGAKAEAYSVFYAQLLRDSFGGWNDNVWSELNHLHLIDEVGHIEDEFTVFEATFPALSLRAKLGTATAFVAFFLFVQWIMFSGAWKMNDRVFRSRPRFQRALITLRMARWIVRDFEPYRRTRRLMRDRFKARRPAWGGLFQFIHW